MANNFIKVKMKMFNSQVEKKWQKQLFFKIGALKSFAIFKGKHLYWNLFFDKVAGPKLVS